MKNHNAGEAARTLATVFGDMPLQPFTCSHCGLAGLFNGGSEFVNFCSVSLSLSLSLYIFDPRTYGVRVSRRGDIVFSHEAQLFRARFHGFLTLSPWKGRKSKLMKSTTTR